MTSLCNDKHLIMTRHYMVLTLNSESSADCITYTWLVTDRKLAGLITRSTSGVSNMSPHTNNSKFTYKQQVHIQTASSHTNNSKFTYKQQQVHIQTTASSHTNNSKFTYKQQQVHIQTTSSHTNSKFTYKQQVHIQTTSSSLLAYAETTTTLTRDKKSISSL